MTRHMVTFFCEDASSPLLVLFFPSPPFPSLPPNSGVTSDSCSTFPDCRHITLSSCPVVNSGSCAVTHAGFPFDPVSLGCKVASCDAGPASLSFLCGGSMGAVGLVCSCRTSPGPGEGAQVQNRDSLRWILAILCTRKQSAEFRSSLKFLHFLVGDADAGTDRHATLLLSGPMEGRQLAGMHSVLTSKHLEPPLFEGRQCVASSATRTPLPARRSQS